MKIVSLVPSITELLYELGLEQEVVGITKFCVYPEHWFRTKTRVGGTKALHIDKIISLQPDLIIANKEENLKEQVEKLTETSNVLVTNVNNYEEALSMIATIGRATHKEAEAAQLIHEIKNQFATLRPVQKKTAAYFIWNNPWMTVGCDTFIHDMLNKAGFANVFGDRTRYPETNLEAVQDLQPEYILLSSEPYPFKQKHIIALQPLFPNTEILLVDGEIFSWYGSRMLLAPHYFKNLLNR